MNKPTFASRFDAMHIALDQARQMDRHDLVEQIERNLEALRREHRSHYGIGAEPQRN